MPSKSELKRKLVEHEERVQRMHLVQPAVKKSQSKTASKKKSSKEVTPAQEPIRTFLVDEEVPEQKDAIVDEAPVLFNEE